MTKENTQSISVIAILLAALLVALGWGISYVNAAPQEDYFATETQLDTNDFSSWISANQTTQVCNAYEAVFDNSTCLQSNISTSDGSNLAAVGGALDKRGNEAVDNNEPAQAEIDLVGKRCVDGGGVVEFDIENISIYKLVNVSTGRVISESATTANFLTFTDLPDGNYEFTSRSQSGDSEEVSFIIDCDEESEIDKSKKLTIQCQVDPTAPKVDEMITWKAAAEGGSGSYSYQWSGDVTGNQQFISTSYSNPGEKVAYLTVKSGGKQRVARCGLNVLAGGEVQGAATVTPRTIEEF